MEITRRKLILAFLVICVLGCVDCVTDPNDLRILIDLKNGLKNPELLKWPDGGNNDPCGTPQWPHVFCSNGKVTQIQVRGLGLEGPLPQDFNQLDKLQNIGLQNNKFNGKLPSLRGLSDLEFAFLNDNDFDTIPSGFFSGLSSVRVLALDDNPLNKSLGWTLRNELAESTQLVNFSCMSTNIVGPLPDFFGALPSLSSLKLSYNRLSGGIPSTFRNSMLQELWLNDQDKGGMNGPISIVGSMHGLTTLWLHGNQFTGSIPDDIGDLTLLRDLNLNGNRLVGLIPTGLANMNLQKLDLNNNMFMGPIPKFKAESATWESNSFCQSSPGDKCSPTVSALLDFLHDLEYPVKLASDWTGNDPCTRPWQGISCNSMKEVTVINLQHLGLNGTLSPSLANLPSLMEIHLESNNLHGPVPDNLTQLTYLRVLNLKGNNFIPPLPNFRGGVKVVIDDNPKFQTNDSMTPNPAPPGVAAAAPSPPNTSDSPPNPPDSPPKTPDAPPNTPDPPPNPPDSLPKTPDTPPNTPDSPPHSHPSPTGELPRPDSPNSNSNTTRAFTGQGSEKSKIPLVAAAAGGSTVCALLVAVFAIYCFRRQKKTKTLPTRVASYPKDPSNHGSIMKTAFTDAYALWPRNSESHTSYGYENEPVNSLVSLDVLRRATSNFSKENELGRGGFGVVYKGKLEDGTDLAVKRMLVGVMCNTALDEFRSEIKVLSKVRHRHLVSLLGYSAQGEEKLLVYEYMPQGALSRHLFRWKSLGLEPLSWTRRLYIALDVARGVEYLHTLAHQSFIHRDLKSANILLDDNYRAKVADFGLVKLAPDREMSVATRLAGTFGYLAPEYAVTGKITTKVDVFSFGIVLMELLTGLNALDEQRPEEKRYLAEWFWSIKSNKESLIASVDPALDAKEDIFETICNIAALAGHCTTRDPNHRPEMGHAVNVLGQLVEKWIPHEETDDSSGIDMTLPLAQMLKGWQEEEGGSQNLSYASLDSKGSIPARPLGFADSFTSNDAR